MAVRSASGLVTLRSRPRRLLAVFAHPDDEAYGCAGALARAAADPEAAVVLLVLTRGEAASFGRERGLSPTQVGRLREERLEEVAAVLDLDGLLVEGLPDGRLARLPLDVLVGPVTEAVEALRPQVLVGHDERGVTAHPDHIAAHWACRQAIHGAPGTRFAMVAYLRETAEAARPRLLLPTAEDAVGVRLELDAAEIEKKERCLRIHEAIATLREDADASLLRRPPVEHYELWGERHRPPLADLFAGCGR